MTLRPMIAAAVLLPCVAYADRPPMPSVAIETSRIGPGAKRVCATIDRKAGQTSVAARAGAWRFASAPPAPMVRSEGEMVAEEYRPGGLTELRDGPDTVLVVARRRGGVVARLTIADIARRPADLPRTTSHRKWSDVRFFDADGRYILDLTDGRRLSSGPTGLKTFTSPPARAERARS